ncbi:e1A-binding protein p400 [Trichonephila clavipes]|nr:e1A-binding protein p400 [Trichonephila clavipes]
MFDEKPTISPFFMEQIKFNTASLALRALDYDPFKHISLSFLNLLLADLELSLTAFSAHRVKKFQVPPKLIVEIDNLPEPPPPCSSVKMKANFSNSQVNSNPAAAVPRASAAAIRLPSSASNRLASPTVVQPQRYMVIPGQQITRAASLTSSAGGQSTAGQIEQYTLQLVQSGSAHQSQLVKEFFAKTRTNVFPHPPHLPDLAPCDFWLFPLKEKRLQECSESSISGVRRKGWEKWLPSVLPEVIRMLAEVYWHPRGLL